MVFASIIRNLLELDQCHEDQHFTQSNLFPLDLFQSSILICIVTNGLDSFVCENYLMVCMHPFECRGSMSDHCLSSKQAALMVAEVVLLFVTISPTSLLFPSLVCFFLLSWLVSQVAVIYFFLFWNGGGRTGPDSDEGALVVVWGPASFGLKK